MEIITNAINSFFVFTSNSLCVGTAHTHMPAQKYRSYLRSSGFGLFFTELHKK